MSDVQELVTHIGDLATAIGNDVQELNTELAKLKEETQAVSSTPEATPINTSDVPEPTEDYQVLSAKKVDGKFVKFWDTVKNINDAWLLTQVPDNKFPASLSNCFLWRDDKNTLIGLTNTSEGNKLPEVITGSYTQRTGFSASIDGQVSDDSNPLIFFMPEHNVEIYFADFYDYFKIFGETDREPSERVVKCVLDVTTGNIIYSDFQTQNQVYTCQIKAGDRIQVNVNADHSIASIINKSVPQPNGCGISLWDRGNFETTCLVTYYFPDEVKEVRTNISWQK